jgi:hypothetical protein
MPARDTGCALFGGQPLLLLLVAVSLSLLCPLASVAQMQEDQMEPAELGISGIDSLRVPAASYVGVDTCRACHASAYRAWLGSSHARSTVGIYSEMATMVAAKEGVERGDLARSGRCLSCHGVAHDTPAASRGPGARMAEGVTCEACHGPQGAHTDRVAHPIGRALASVRTAALRAVRSIRLELGGTTAVQGYSEDRCMGCHKLGSSHEKDGMAAPFSFESRWKQILHGSD